MKESKRPLKSQSRAKKSLHGNKRDRSQPALTLVEEANPAVFRIIRAGKHREYKVRPGFGYFINSFRKATNIRQISEVIDVGIAAKEIEPVVEYLEFKVPEIARAAAVSASTVSRWEPETSIGVAGTNQFFRIDEVIRKGVELFGTPEELKTWLESPNLALGNQVPARLLTSQIGTELVDEALDALHFGTVM